MKKSLINIFLIIVLIALIVGVVAFTRLTVMFFQDSVEVGDKIFSDYYRNQAIMHLIFAFIQTIGFILNFVLIIYINKNDLSFIKNSTLESLSAQKTARKEAAKQKRIEELKAELSKLEKD